METVININPDGRCFISTDMQKYKTQILKIMEKDPAAVRIIAEPENNQGMLYCELLEKKCLNLRFPRRVDLSIDQRQKIAERLKNSHVDWELRTNGEEVVNDPDDQQE